MKWRVTYKGKCLLFSEIYVTIYTLDNSHRLTTDLSPVQKKYIHNLFSFEFLYTEWHWQCITMTTFDNMAMYLVTTISLISTRYLECTTFKLLLQWFLDLSILWDCLDLNIYWYLLISIYIWYTYWYISISILIPRSLSQEILMKLSWGEYWIWEGNFNMYHCLKATALLNAKYEKNYLL